MPQQEKMMKMPASAKSSSAGLEKRKHSQKGSQSAKTSPAREMAPFFSIFYRGITKINRSQSRGGGGAGDNLLDNPRGDRDRDRDGGGGGPRERCGEEKKYAADKPPLPLKSKGNVADAAQRAKGGGGRSRSTVELAKERAAAEGRMWREPSSPNDFRGSKKGGGICSAPSSPQSQRRWPWGGRRQQSEEPPPLPMGAQNGHSEGGNNGFIQDQPAQWQDQPAQQRHSQPPPPPMMSSTFHPLPVAAQKPPPAPASSLSPLSFAQRIKLHKGVRTGKIPVDALKQANGGGVGHQHFAGLRGSSGGGGGGGASGAIGRTAASFFGGTKKAGGKKGMPGGTGGGGLYMSADAIHELSHNPEYIAEALRTLGDEQPRVARSTPKHAYISQDPKRVHDRLRRDCLYTEDVYDKMVQDSLLVCDLLQTHLDEVITGVRARSPTALSSPFTTPPGSPFMTRSTSMHIPGGGGARAVGASNATINRVTISVSPMAQQANPTSPSPRPSGASLPPFPISLSPTTIGPPPLVRVTPASLRGSQFGSPRSSEKRLQFVS